MSVWSVTLALALSIALGGIIAVSAWTIDDVLDDRRDMQNVLAVALAYRDHMTASRCTVPVTPLSLSGVRTALIGAGQTHAAVENEAAWRIAFDGGSDRQTAVTLYKVDGASRVTQSNSFTLPLPGGDRTHQFFDVVFDSRICP